MCSPRGQALKTALKRQHGSLHLAYTRIRQAEGELARAQGAHSEELERLRVRCTRL